MTARPLIIGLLGTARACWLLFGSARDLMRARHHLALCDAYVARAEARLLVARDLGGSAGGRRDG
jgi:hypothetical protein